MDNGEVTFRYHDKDRKRNLIMTIKATEFIRRFMQHVLPSGFYKIRYYGILASVNVKKRLEDAFSLVFGDVMLPSLEGLNALEVLAWIIYAFFVMRVKSAVNIGEHRFEPHRNSLSYFEK